MKFGDEEQEISPFWLDYYRELGLAVPLDQLIFLPNIRRSSGDGSGAL